MRAKTIAGLLVTACLTWSATALAQVENPDFRIRAKFRTPNDGSWISDESVGGADFRVQSRFLQVYYGGVHRQDEFKFKVSLDFTLVSGFAENFPGSIWDTDYDVYINDGFVGRLYMNTSTLGEGALEYDSRHPDPPALPLPEEFPDPVGPGDVARAFPAAATLPAFGDPLPAGTPLFEQTFGEEFARGDVNQDGKVDEDDFPFLDSNFDPADLFGPHIGPVAGDFTGDNRADIFDYYLFLENWTDSHDPPAAPAGATDAPTPTIAAPGLRLAIANPFVHGREIRLYVPAAGEVSLDIFDVSGARVASRAVPTSGAGWQSIPFAGRSDGGATLPAGRYFYRARAGRDVVTGSFVLLR
ncbi:MAG: hypothetical protein KC591_06285 [Gemmatimonadetes bacterium]|nr:hypothetical protein [Gemmatimonadota bacterium]